jgi:hypothetical protein
MPQEYKPNTIFPIIATTAALARAFGIRSVMIPKAKDNDFEQSKLSQGFQEPDAKLYDSPIGTPVYADITLEGGSYTDNITQREVNFPTLKFSSVILSVTFSARIVKTEIQGRNGTVKEYIGEDDPAVRIQGIITGWNGHYPAEEVSALNEWRKAPVAKAVTSTYLQNLGITNLVVENMEIPQVAGGYSYQTFSIDCIGDIPVELKITS